ncbi:hypothetical protein B0A48_01357 [Cryoendolithus antarcticus]|uniref:Very-long-chain (3R)-3-hydroxyacyl-CoA dehydratase n=1 Tax=Cryoendolithus antarcticus TaxID=1507870 RepID=A0A1V8TT24_9PEZI|nr:hypothetical protein B0A48_01357 [Cryoendolithus antarcticus]
MSTPSNAQLPPPTHRHPPRSSSKSGSTIPILKPTKIPSSASNGYLILYNAVSAALWANILTQVCVLALGEGYAGVFEGLDEFVRVVQTLAGMEVLHSAIGLVRAPLLTTIMQVASRFLLVWGIAFFFPGSTASSPAYTTMLLAWSLTEVIRYSYFVINLTYGYVPDAITWLRYNTFLVLYPLGISSECWLVYRAMGQAGKMGGEGVLGGNATVWWALVGVLAVYVPGSWVLFTHMLGQRTKVMKTLKTTRQANASKKQS